MTEVETTTTTATMSVMERNDLNDLACFEYIAEVSTHIHVFLTFMCRCFVTYKSVPQMRCMFTVLSEIKGFMSKLDEMPHTNACDSAIEALKKDVSELAKQANFMNIFLNPEVGNITFADLEQTFVMFSQKVLSSAPNDAIIPLELSDIRDIHKNSKLDPEELVKLFPHLQEKFYLVKNVLVNPLLRRCRESQSNEQQ